MPKPDLGKKLTCPSCGARFYDLNKSPAICPKCETQFEAQQLLKPKRQPAEEPKKAAPAKETEEAKDDDEDVLEDGEDLEIDDDDDDLMEDTSDLDEDDDDMSEVKEHMEVEDVEDND